MGIRERMWSAASAGEKASSLDRSCRWGHRRSPTMSDCQREMTLKEYVEQLPTIHRARREYEKLVADRSKLIDELSYADLRADGGLPEAKTMAVEDWRELGMECARAFSRERVPGGVFYLEMPQMIRELEAALVEKDAEIRAALGESNEKRCVGGEGDGDE